MPPFITKPINMPINSTLSSPHASLAHKTRRTFLTLIIVVVMISDQILFFAALHVFKNVWMIKVTVLGLANITTEEVCRTYKSVR